MRIRFYERYLAQIEMKFYENFIAQDSMHYMNQMT